MGWLFTSKECLHLTSQFIRAVNFQLPFQKRNDGRVGTALVTFDLRQNSMGDIFSQLCFDLFCERFPVWHNFVSFWGCQMTFKR